MADPRAAFFAGLPLAVPCHDPRAGKAGIVHLGVGAFHRAHQAPVIDACLAAEQSDWAITGVAMRSAAMRDALNTQGYAYTLATADAGGERLRIVSAHRAILLAPAQRAAVVAALAAPDTRIVTLTVTEAGYLRASDGTLDADAVHETSIHALLLDALAQRRAAGRAPFTLLSCDNLPMNGATLRRLLTAYAEVKGMTHLLDGLACPNAMVDRITPATTEEDRARIAATLGKPDAAPVIAEPFLQWVIEEDFAQGRPDWEGFGVQMVRDVAPWEEMKLRLLNGAHSLIAYAGVLAGHDSVAQAFGDPAIRGAVQRLWETARATLSPAMQKRAVAFSAALTSRFDNPALRHACAQIANDGSQKLPQRILAPAAHFSERPTEAAPLLLAIALWAEAMRRHGGRFSDPAMARLRPAIEAPAQEAAAALLAALGAGDTPFTPVLADLLCRVRAKGVATLIPEEG